MAIQTLNTIKNWFKTSLKPTQDQFWDTWDSFRHKFEKVPLKDVEDLEVTLNKKAEKAQLDAHQTDLNAHSDLFAKKEDNANKGVANGYVPLDDVAKIASQYLNIINDLVAGGSNSLLSAEQGKILQNQINGIHTLLQSDNVNLDTLQEIVDAIEDVQISLSTLLVNDLITGGATKALTAEMGKYLHQIKLSATIATDEETQIEVGVPEDNKVISRSKLFNWWEWLKSQTQTISGIWNFTNKIILASGNTNEPSLIIPTGTLTSTPQNGALERDSSGKLWTTRNGARYILTEDDGSYVKILINGSQMTLDTPPPYVSTNLVTDTLLGSFPAGSLSNNILARLSMIASTGDVVAGGGSTSPLKNEFQIVIKFTNALLCTSYWGPGTIDELILIDNLNLNGTTTMLAGTYSWWDQNVGLFNGHYVWEKNSPSTPKNLNTVEANIYCRRRIEFADSTNENNDNQAIRVWTEIKSTLVERIRF